MSAVAKPRRRTQVERSETTRQQLLDAAIDCVYELGFNGATLMVVAERAGVTRGAVQHHFGNKNDLYIALIDEIGNRLHVDVETVAPKGSSVADRIKAIAQQYWSVINSRNFVAAMQIQLGTMNDPTLHDQIRDALHRTEAALDNQWIEVFADHEIIRENAIAARHVILASMRGLALRQIYRKNRRSWDRELELLCAMFEQLVVAPADSRRVESIKARHAKVDGAVARRK